MSKRAEETALEVYPDFRSMDGGYITQRKARANFIKGYEQAEKDIGWHSVEESLPEIDEVVIVLTNDDGFTPPCSMKICFAHLVYPCVSTTVEGKIYKPRVFGGWNIPGVKFWMPMPKLPEE